jgi:hypothetical protein
MTEASPISSIPFKAGFSEVWRSWTFIHFSCSYRVILTWSINSLDYFP